jgi:hypothetical protein
MDDSDFGQTGTRFIGENFRRNGRIADEVRTRATGSPASARARDGAGQVAADRQHQVGVRPRVRGAVACDPVKAAPTITSSVRARPSSHLCNASRCSTVNLDQP